MPVLVIIGNKIVILTLYFFYWRWCMCKDRNAFCQVDIIAVKRMASGGALTVSGLEDLISLRPFGCGDGSLSNSRKKVVPPSCSFFSLLNIITIF